MGSEPHHQEGWIGASLLRKEDAKHLNGHAMFVADVRLPGMQDIAFLRSPVAHGILKRITKPSADAKNIYTIDDFPDLNVLDAGPELEAFRQTPYPALASKKMRYVGQAIAACVAPNRAKAEDLCEQVELDYEELPAVVDAVDAMASTSAKLFENWPDNAYITRTISAGDLEALKNAPVRVPCKFRMNRQATVSMETRGCVAYWDRRQQELLVYLSTQGGHVMRLGLSRALGLAENKIRVIAPDVGGGFGTKGKLYPEETILAWASLKLAQPLKWVSTRSEAFVSDYHARDHSTHAEMALDEQGHILAVRVKTHAALGAYVSTVGAAVPTTVYTAVMSGPYKIPAIFAEVHAMFTNTVPTDAYRGAGRPEACFVLERLIEEAAVQTGMDRFELRRKNFIARQDMPYSTPLGPTYDSGDFIRLFEQALQLADHAGFAERRRA